jgi:hypothetical protein
LLPREPRAVKVVSEVRSQEIVEFGALKSWPHCAENSDVSQQAAELASRANTGLRQRFSPVVQAMHRSGRARRVARFVA